MGVDVNCKYGEVINLNISIVSSPASMSQIMA
jgi:hypothetical protein